MYESMSSKGKLKESLKRGGNSVRHQRTPKSGDIESQPSSMTPKTSFAKVVFALLLKTIQQKRCHVDSEKRVVYTKLMDHLDAVEVGHSPSTVVLVSIELLVFLGLLAALVCSLKLAWVKHRSFLGMPMWEYVALLMMIASGLSVVRFLTFVASWPVLRWWRIHKYAVFFIRRLKRCVDVALWFSIILLGWYVWFRPRLRHVHNELSEVLSYHVTRFLISLSLGSFLWVCKNALYLKLEADLHYDQLFDRIRQSVLYLHGLQIIHTRGMWKFLPDNKTKRKLMEIMTNSTPSLYGQSEGANHARDVNIQMKGENIWMLVLLMEKESAPVWILRRLAEEYLDQVKLRPLPGSSRITKDEQKILMEATKLFRQLVVKRIHDHEEPDNDISDHEIKRDDLKDYGLLDKELDFIFRPTKQEEVEEEEDGERGGGGDEIISNSTPKERTIGYDEFMNQAVRAYKNCWGLERTLRSSKKVFIKLNRLLCTFLLMVVLIVWLLLSQIVDSGQLALLFTPFLAATFIFGESCREMFEGLIFAFAMHPFDVGDRVIIDNVQMRVTELNILTSVFYKYDTGEEVITPNSKLTTTSIINLDITPDQSDKVEFTIAADTPLEDMTDLEIKVKKFMDDDIKFSSNNKVVKSEVVKDEVKMTVYLKYLVSYLSSESKAVHKSNILTRIMEFQKDMKKNSKKNVCFREPYYTLDITLNRKVKLKHIQDLEAQILRGVKPCYTPSKVVVKEVKESQVKMGLYLTYPDNVTEDVQRSDKQDKSESEPLNTLMKATIMKETEKNLYNISEELNRNKFVTKLQILGSLTNSKDYVIIAQGGIGWDSLEARDVVHTKDHSVPSLETMPSGIGCSSSSERSST